MGITRYAKTYKIIAQNKYEAFVGSKLDKLADDVLIDALDGDVVLNSTKKVIAKATKQVFFKEPQEIKRKGIEEVVSIDTKLYLQSSANLKTPYLNSKDTINYESSKLFIAGLRSIFGCDIKHTAAKDFKTDLESGSAPLPEWKFEKFLSDTEGGFHRKGTIHLSEKLILKAEKDPATNWLLFRVIIEELGHYVDYLLRNKYDTIGGDAKGDEGTLFAADFIKYNNLLSKDFKFATFKIKSEEGDIRTFTAKVSSSQPDREQKALELLFIEDDDDDHGIVTLNSGKKVKVEFFKIRGGGAIHESITEKAAEKVGFTYDKRLDEGCAWPDVPCEDENSIETCYYNTWRDEHTEGTMAYKSHHGSKQFWHSMAPTGTHTNAEIVDLIVNQAKKWFKKGIDIEIHSTLFSGKKDDGLFHIGKILHMVQDSYSLSHVHRNAKNEILQIQSYNEQDSHKHGEPDKQGDSQEAKNALEASILVLQLYKDSKNKKTEREYTLLLDNLFRTKIYAIATGYETIIAGGSLDTYKKDTTEE